MTPLRDTPPRPPDGVGRQAIRTTLPAANGRSQLGDGDRHVVARRRAGRWLLVVLAADAVVLVGRGLVDGWSAPDWIQIALLVVSMVAAIVGLVATRSGGRR